MLPFYDQVGMIPSIIPSSSPRHTQLVAPTKTPSGQGVMTGLGMTGRRARAAPAFRTVIVLPEPLLCCPSRYGAAGTVVVLTMRADLVW
jgi:hypothetical protein